MQWSHLRIATKYPNITKRYFAARGVQAECIKLNGAMELAPRLGLCRGLLIWFLLVLRYQQMVWLKWKKFRRSVHDWR